MKMKLFQLLDPRENRMPADTSRIIKPRAPHRVPLVNPDLLVQNNPGIKRQLAKYHSFRPSVVRAENRARMQRMVDEVNRVISQQVRYKGIRFDLDERSGRLVVVVRDLRSGDVIKQFPAEELLQVAARLDDAAGKWTDIEA